MKKEIENIVTYDNDGGGTYACNFKGVPIDDWNARGICAFSYEYNIMRLKGILGKVLTVIDASFSNDVQKKAVKDIIRNDFALLMSDLWETSEPNFQEIIEESMAAARDKGLDESVLLEEVLGA